MTLNTSRRLNQAADALSAHFAGMPPVAALHPVIADCARPPEASAPLDAQRHDNGCAFCGILVFADDHRRLGLVFLEWPKPAIEADIVVADSRLRYLKPVVRGLVVDPASTTL